MYPITNAVKALFESEQRQTLRITGTDKNNTAISITDADVLIDGFNIDRFSCVNDRIEIGTATAAEMTLRLNNTSGAFDSIIFEGAELFVEIGIADWSQANPTINYIPCGYFTPNEQPRRMNVITLKALDRMAKFDVAVDASALSMPASVSSIVGQVCTICNVTLAASVDTLPNATLTISELPAIQQEMTYRNLIQWCAGIMGTCAYMDWDGKLAFAWYSAASYISTPANRFSSDLFENDIEITGVEYTNTQNVAIIAGTTDYTLDLTGNYLMSGYASEVLTNINTALNGFTYRPFAASVLTAPYLWPMDIITFTDKDGNDHNCIVTNVNFGLNSTTEIEGKGMTDQLNGQLRPSGMTVEQGFMVEKAIQAAIDDVDDSLTQQEIFNRLTNNGQEQGIYLQNGKIYISASYIQSGHLSADYLQGGTLESTAQVGNDPAFSLDMTNGFMQMLDSTGTKRITLDTSNGEMRFDYRATTSDSFTTIATLNAGGLGVFSIDMAIGIWLLSGNDGIRIRPSNGMTFGYGSPLTRGISINPLNVTGSETSVYGNLDVTGDLLVMNGIKSGNKTVPTILASDSHSFSNVAAGGTDSYAVSASLGTNDYVVSTEINTGNCVAYITNRASTGFTVNVKNISSASSSPTVRLAVIKTS